MTSQPPLAPEFDKKITKNTDTTALLPDSTNRRYMTDAQRTWAASQSGTNTGDQTFTLSGDVSGTGTGAITTTLASIISAATKGGAAKTLTVTVDAKGRITSLTESTIAITASQVTDIGDLPATWVTGVKKTNVKQYFAAAVVATGAVSLAHAGASAGPAVSGLFGLDFEGLSGAHVRRPCGEAGQP